MGDLANMTDCDGRVHGTRMLLWLRSRAAVEREDEKGCGELCCVRLQHWHRGRADLLTEMADDLERELTPPDYPGDDDDTVDLDDKDTGPCEGCGRLADRVPVRDNGRVWFACPACAAQVEDDTVNLDEMADMKTCPDCGREHRGKAIGRNRCLACAFEREKRS